MAATIVQPARSSPPFARDQVVGAAVAGAGTEAASAPGAPAVAAVEGGTGSGGSCSRPGGP